MLVRAMDNEEIWYSFPYNNKMKKITEYNLPKTARMLGFLFYIF